LQKRTIVTFTYFQRQFELRPIFDHPRSDVIYNFGRVCLSVCLSDDNFRKAMIGSLYLHIQYISREYGSSSYMKVIESK